MINGTRARTRFQCRDLFFAEQSLDVGLERGGRLEASFLQKSAITQNVPFISDDGGEVRRIGFIKSDLLEIANEFRCVAFERVVNDAFSDLQIFRSVKIEQH